MGRHFATTSRGWSDRTWRIDRGIVMAIRTDRSARTTRTDGTDRTDKSERTDRTERFDFQT